MNLSLEMRKMWILSFSAHDARVSFTPTTVEQGAPNIL
jgi:hypothetical protein